MDNDIIGIMGGTFDPIHHGHLILAEYVASALNLDKVLFIPSGIPHFKLDKKVSSQHHRLTMTKLAIRHNDRFEVSTIEVDRSGNTYTVDTMEELNKKYPLTTFYFIIGADSVFDLLKWKNYSRLFEICHFAVANRGGTYSKEELNNQIKMLTNQYKANITQVHIPDIQISSSEIRNRVKNSQSVRYLIPDKVEEYIHENKLYINI